MIRIARILFTFFLSLSFALPTFAQTDATLIKEILTETNKFRASEGLLPLQSNDFLQKMATNHSKNMASGKVAFGHDGFTERSQQARANIPETKGRIGENVAYGSLNAVQVLDMWKKSAGHRENLAGAFKYIGIGVGRAANGTIFFTQIFAN